MAIQRGGSPLPVDENAIKEQARKTFQTTIDAIDAEYANSIRQQTQVNENNSGQTRAIDARSGLLGSDFGAAHQAGQEKMNSAALKALEDERSMKIAEVNNRISQSAKEEIAAKKAEALGNSEAYSKHLEKTQEDAKGYLESLAKSGTDLEKLGANKAQLFKMAGLDENLENCSITAWSPKLQRLTTRPRRPRTTKFCFTALILLPATKTVKVDTSVPDGYDPTYVDGQLYFKSQTDGSLIPAPMDQSLYTPGYKDYLLSKKEGFTGNYNDYQTADANRKRSVSVTNLI